MTQTREKWIDHIKIFACILVALGHFFQSMIHADILQETFVSRWFETTIYYFHVPLFFLCSGYLYQKQTGKPGFGGWCSHVLQKALTLGVPYLVFSVATWLLKEVFSGAVNEQNMGLLQTLFVSPASPYWYLYTLFFAFVITPRLRNRAVMIAVAAAAVALKALRVLGLVNTGIYAVDSVMDNVLWFVLGMLLQYRNLGERQPDRRLLVAGVTGFAAFLCISVGICGANRSWSWLAALMGLWGCISVVLILKNWNLENKLTDWAAKYTMPVFLMHTIFAAGLRAVLLKLGITNPVIHVSCGILISFAGPVIAAMIMQWLRLDILLYPLKYRKKKH